ncbi:MAG: PKD domain-containing protein [Thermoplasmatota archaeon]
MNYSKLLKRYMQIFGLVVLLSILVLSVIPLAESQNNNSQGRVDILFDGENLGNETQVYIPDTEEVSERTFEFSISLSGNLSYEDIENVTWNFGDGSETADEYNISHAFQAPEEGETVYQVNLTLEANGNIYEDTFKIRAITDTRGTYLTALGAGLAVGIAGMGAGIGVGIAGAAGAGTIAEKPEKFGKCLVFQALPQTQAIYGLLVAVLLLLFTGIIGAETNIPLSIGVTSLGVGLAVGIAGLSAIGQGIAASGSIAAYSEKEELFGRGMVFSVLPETQAIYGLLVGILIMVFTGLLGGAPKLFMVQDSTIGVAFGTVGIGAGLAVGIAGLSGIGQGIAASAGIGSVAEREDLFGKGMVFSVLPETQAIYGMLIAILLMVSSGLLQGTIDAKLFEIATQFDLISVQSVGLIAVGAGLAVGIAGLSGIGQGIAASSGIGCVAEKEEMFGKAMVFSVLPETQAIYGMLIAILLMVSTPLLGEVSGILFSLGLVGVGAGLAVGIAGLSGIGQGIAAASGIATVSEDEAMFGKGMVFSVLPETQAIYGLLIAILLMVFSGILGTVTEPTTTLQGIASVGAGIAIGIAGVSGVGQGITSGSAIAAVSKREDTFGKGMIFSVMSETFAIFGLLIAIFIILFALM